MLISYRWTTTVIGLAIAALILYLVRRDHMHGPYALWWLIVAATVAFLGAFPGLFDKIALLLGVHYPPILLVVIGLGLLLVKMLTVDLERSRQERKVRRLIQRLALLEERLERQLAQRESERK